MKEILAQLNSIATSLDNFGYIQESDTVTKVMSRIANSHAMRNPELYGSDYSNVNFDPDIQQEVINDHIQDILTNFQNGIISKAEACKRLEDFIGHSDFEELE